MTLKEYVVKEHFKSLIAKVETLFVSRFLVRARQQVQKLK